MKVQLVAFGIARDILGTSKTPVILSGGKTIGALKEQLLIEYNTFADLASIAFAVNEEYQQDDFELKENDEVVIIPPV
ncbi:MAG: MoaD/ThiS family protein, partial [Bacteroidota bacterium]